MAGIKSLKIGNTGEPFEFIDQVSRTQIEETREQVESVDTSLDIKADTDLSNLSSTSQAVLDAKQNIATAINYTNITNCITEIPQDIKLELNDGVLTLKAGSKVYVPNGLNGTTPKFDIYTETVDKTISLTDNASQFICVNANTGGLQARPVQNSVSGAGVTTTAGFAYNTTTNKIRFYNVDGVDQGFDNSLPIAIVTVSSATITSIEQVFNGFGYIGSTVFALPGVKGLIPNGRNADGSLKNVEFTVDKVFIDTIVGTLTDSNYYISTYNIGFYGRKFYSVKSKKDISTTHNSIFYVQDDNLMYIVSNQNLIQNIVPYIPFCVYSASDSKITSFTPKLPFHAVDYNDSSWVAGQAMPSGKYVDLTLGASGSSYTAPANGWFTFSKTAGITNGQISLTNDTVGFGCTAIGPSAGYNLLIYLPVKAGDVVRTTYSATGTTNYFRFIYAEGEN